jgi:hypothetical protein
MKNVTTLFVVFISLFLSVRSIAQTAKNDNDMIQQIFGQEKGKLVSTYMKIRPSDSVAFWSLYNEYEIKRKELGKSRIAILQQYVDTYDTMDDASALKLSESAIDLEIKYDQLQQTYLKKFGKAVGGKTAATFFQLESYFKNLTRQFIMNNIPFLGELNNTKATNK